MLTIWDRLNSHDVKKVAWFARELGIDYKRHDIGGKFGMTDAYRALNPNALIPTIEHNGLVPLGIERDPALPRRTPRRRALLTQRSSGPRR